MTEMTVRRELWGTGGPLTECRGANQLADGQAKRAIVEGRKGRKDVGAPVAKRQKRHARRALVEAQDGRYRRQVWAEKVGRGYADEAKEKGEDADEAEKDEGPRGGRGMVVPLLVWKVEYARRVDGATVKGALGERGGWGV